MSRHRSEKSAIGTKFGRLTIKDSTRLRNCVCVCDCGKEIITQFHKLTTGHTRSCGCLQRELLSKNRTKHGFLRGKRASEGNIPRFYWIWVGLRNRCNNSGSDTYHRWGGRGIKVCKRWDDFGKFREDMEPTYKPGLTIERKNNNGPYCKSNCVWADQTTQANNRRSNRILTINGKSKTMAQWSREKGAESQDNIWSRLNRGWDAERAVFG